MCVCVRVRGKHRFLGGRMIGFPPRCVWIPPRKSPWRLGFTHPPAPQSRLSPAPAPLPGYSARPPDGRATFEVHRLGLPPKRSRTAAAVATGLPPTRTHTPGPGPCRHPGSGHGRGRLLPGGGSLDGNPDGAAPGQGSRGCLETVRGFACVVICRPYLRTCQKER